MMQDKLIQRYKPQEVASSSNGLRPGLARYKTLLGFVSVAR